MTSGSADDAAGLQAWLRQHVDPAAGVTVVGQSTAGARRRNVILDVADSAGRTEGFVATILPTADIALLSMADESGVRGAARAAGVPVPEVVTVCPTAADSPLGAPFFVSRFVDGETIPRRLLRLVDEHDLGHRVTEQLGEAMARLHAVDVSLAPLGLVRTSAPVATALDGVIAATGLLLQAEPAYAYGVRWLGRHRPSEPGRPSIVHADIRTGNIIVDRTGLQAILDWETSKISDPMEDLAWVCTRMWRFGRDHLPVGGLGTVSALRDAYTAAGGAWDDDRFLWWRVLTTLRWGLGLAGQAGAHLNGTFTDIVMAASGRRVSEIAYDVLTLVASDADPFV